MKKVIAKIICFLFGHTLIKEGEYDNGFSKFGESRCSRCGYHHQWQYDYKNY